MPKTYIPEMSAERVDELSQHIKPICRFNDVQHYIKPVDLHNIAYTWNPEAAEVATNLTTIHDITTYHTYGYYGLFKPSIAEVLKQIPDDVRDQVVAFEIINTDDLIAEDEALNDGYHVAKTRLYG